MSTQVRKGRQAPGIVKHDLLPEELHAAVGKVIKQIARKVGIEVYDTYNLRTPRAVKQDLARRHGGEWTLFINTKGSLCHAVHRSGSLHLFESPDTVHNCFHKEYAINFFVNHMRSITNRMNIESRGWISAAESATHFGGSLRSIEEATPWPGSSGS